MKFGGVAGFGAGIWICLVSVNVTGDLRVALVGGYGVPGGVRSQTAETLRAYAARETISRIVSTGPNFRGGIRGLKDLNFIQGFEETFSSNKDELKVPLLLCLGSDDWSGNVQAYIERAKLDYAEGTSQGRAVLTFPNWWYHHTVGFTAKGGVPLLGSQEHPKTMGFFMMDSFVASSAFPSSTAVKKANQDMDLFLETGAKFYDYMVVVSDKKFRGVADGNASLGALEKKLVNAQVDVYLSGGSPGLEYVDVGGVLHLQCNSFASHGSGGSGDQMRGDTEKASFLSKRAGFCVLEAGYEGLKIKLIDGETGKVIQELFRPKKVRRERDYLSPFTQFSKLPAVEYHPLPVLPVGLGADLDFESLAGTAGVLITAGLLLLFAATQAGKMMD